MNILACIKQVPGTNKVDMDSETGVLKRSPLDNKINPYDLYAIEAAVRLREEHGGKVTVLSMGPPQAEEIIREAFSLGADEGVLLTDRRFAGADVLATSYALAGAIKALGGFDLIICGKQTTDGDTAQVAPALSQWLRLPIAAWVKKINAVNGGEISVTQDTGEAVYELKMPLPCVISADSGIFEPRLPSYKLKKATENRCFKTMTLDDLEDRNPGRYGLDGSPTRVERIFPPPVNSQSEFWELSAAEAVERLLPIVEVYV